MADEPLSSKTKVWCPFPEGQQQEGWPTEFVALSDYERLAAERSELEKAGKELSAAYTAVVVENNELRQNDGAMQRRLTEVLEDYGRLRAALTEAVPLLRWGETFKLAGSERQFHYAANRCEAALAGAANSQSCSEANSITGYNLSETKALEAFERTKQKFPNALRELADRPADETSERQQCIDQAAFNKDAHGLYVKGCEHDWVKAESGEPREWCWKCGVEPQ